MPWNGSGTFNRKHNWTQEAAVGTPILATNFDDDTNDITSVGLGNCITRDGQGGPAANISWNNFKITNLANPTLAQDGVTLSFMQTAITQATFNTALPSQPGNAGKFVTTDGTNASWSNVFGVAVDEAKGANIASAATINLSTGVGTGNLIHITGTTTITAMTIPSGAERTLVFDGILTLTNSANLILPSGANITTAAGDSCKVRGDGASVARVVSYTTATGRALVVTPPGLVKIAGPVTPLAAPTADFLSLFNSTYDNYRIIIDGITPAADDSLLLRVAVANAADSTSNYYGGLPSGTVITASATSAPITAGVTTTAGSGASFTIDILNVNDAVRAKQILASGASQRNATPGFIVTQQNTQFNRANVVTGFQLLWSTASNFSAVGSITVYGYSKV